MGYGQSRRSLEAERRQLPRSDAEKRSSRGSKGRRRARRLRLESLEARYLLTAGPELLADVGLDEGWSREFTAVGDTVYFTNGGADLWKTDGTPANTEKIATITHPDLSASAVITDFVDAGGVLAFVVFDYGSDLFYTDDHRVQFWKSNGTPGGTVMVADLGVGSTLPVESGNVYLTAVGSQVFGVISTPTAGYELWVSDLNPANPTGTYLVKDIYPGADSADPFDLLAFGGKLYFAADDGVRGSELWVSDGTQGGTQIVKDIKGNQFVNFGSYPTDLTAGDGEFFFGTLDPGADSNPLTTADNRVELWRSDGTQGGTVLVHQFVPGTTPPGGLYGDPQLTYIPETGKLFGIVEFQDGGVRSQDLVCWDGTTMHHWNLFQGGNDWVGNLSPAFGSLGFGADDGPHGREPWLTDGDSTNPLGTLMIKDVYPGDGSGIDAFKAGVASFPFLGEVVYFPADDGVNGIELWRSDGSAGGTVLVADIRPGPESGEPNSSYPYDLTAAQGKLFFGALDDTLSYNPWVLDPSAPDIRAQQATADGEAAFQVAYQIVGDAMPTFDFGFFLSNDPFLDPSDVQIDTATIGDPAELSVGSHTKIFTIGSGPGEIALPGAGVTETDDEYYVLVVADPEDLIEEADVDPVQEDNTVPLSGVYHPPGGDVFVHGTLGDDTTAVSPGSLELVVNGATLAYDLATTTGLRIRSHAGADGTNFDGGSGFAATPALPSFFHGGTGDNTLTLRGSTGNDLAKIYPSRVEMSGPGYSLQGHAAGKIYVYGSAGGDDEVQLYDSAGDDTLLADGASNGVRLQGPGFDNYVEGFDRSYAYATAGGSDTTRLYDSAGDDLFLADGKANGARFQGTGFDLYAEGFEKTYAYATAGGTNTAKLYDSAGDDLFLADGKANGARFQGTGFDLYAESFEKTYAYATAGGTNTAKLYDSAGDDLFLADGTANGMRLQGGGIDLYAEKFEKTYAYATGGGADSARLYDSAGDDLFLADGEANGVRLQGLSIDLYAENFEKTYGYATGGGSDTAKLFDSAGDDTFTTDGAANGARLQGGGIDLYAEGFEKTYAYATGGGIDTARMYDSAGDDTFAIDHPGGRFQGLGFDAYAENFEWFFAYATRGGYDRSYVYDTDGDDALVGGGNWYELTTPYENVRGEGFDYVKATKHEAGTDTLDVDAVDYLFETEGPWLPVL